MHEADYGYEKDSSSYFSEFQITGVEWVWALFICCKYPGPLPAIIGSYEVPASCSFQLSTHCACEEKLMPEWGVLHRQVFHLAWYTQPGPRCTGQRYLEQGTTGTTRPPGAEQWWSKRQDTQYQPTVCKPRYTRRTSVASASYSQWISIQWWENCEESGGESSAVIGIAGHTFSYTDSDNTTEIKK